jgi:Phage protein Gp138 N-terminal domain
VQPLVRRGFFDERGERTAELLPVVDNVPVEFMGGGNMSLTFAITKGMTCRLQVCSCSLDKWLAKGGEVDPEDDRRFALTDAVCVLGLRDFKNPINGAAIDGWVMATAAGTSIRLGSASAFEPPHKGLTFNTTLQTFLTALNAYVTGIQGTADPSNTFTPALLTAISTFSAALAGTLASKVKVE